MPRKCQLRVQRSFDWTEEAEVSAGTKRARDFPFGGQIPLALESRAEVFSRRKDANKPCYTQIVRLAFFGRCWGPGGTRRSQIGPVERGDIEQDKEPSLKQVAPGEVPETGTTRMRETVLAEVAQRSPTSPETNLESRAMQVRGPWTQASLCTKDFRRKCTGAGVAAKSRFPAMQPSEVRQGLTSTKLGLKSHWTVGVTWTESLDSRDLARRAERRPKGPVMQLFGACGCRWKIPSTHGRFLRSFWCREEAGYPHSMHKQENSREGGRISVTELQ
ncbi:hypothetical protein NDU88_007560 [Pleurodeles waltl]|uniref:Uncharacterized protein n=1 Tax=Pleurodeles waltl TaxID=8319 RepID=A0AAV7MJ30_PLEWA|nr:hypothetical protein NDU88_007560 [Pleurodeles waltl]